MMRQHRAWMALGALALACAAAGWMSRPAPTADMAAAATAFLDSLSQPLRAKAQLPFESASRTDWHYIPRDRSGLEFSQMDAPQRTAARSLMHRTLSSQGAGKVEQIMLLDNVLRDLEQGSGPRRDPLAFSITIFGTPGTSPWGWKLEGHHISLNFTGSGDQLATTPAFLGANPATVRSGDRAGTRVLAAEEDLGRSLLRSLSPEQHAEAVVSPTAPGDILATPSRSPDDVDNSGLRVAMMTPPQRALVEQLLREYAGNLRHELAEQELARIHAAGLDDIRFAWMGGDKPGQGHYYRLSGPTFIIEYDNTQNNANHVHTVWRDRTRDFGRDLLKEHLEHDHQHAPHHESHP